jgi:PAS domain S-box-containing protein
MGVAMSSQFAVEVSFGDATSLLDALPVLVWRADRTGELTYVNRTWLTFTGGTLEEQLGTGWLKRVHPDDRTRTEAAFAAHVRAGEAFELQYRFRRADGEFRWLLSRGAGAAERAERVGTALDFQPGHDLLTRAEKAQVVAEAGQHRAEEGQRVAEDAQRAALQAQRAAEEAQRRAEVAQRERDEHAAELARSNAELEQFAYVASHDLQEPLRMVASYVQLLARRYQGQLDGDADKFIRYAADGAARMQRLINDLLAFSRAGTRPTEASVVWPAEILTQTLADLREAIAESRADVSCGELPAVRGDAQQIAQLFQNLVGNAIKFRGEAPPVVQLDATREGGWVEFRVRDNGIGIDPQFFERIFIIFQRLHGPTKYPGTGIGLALCKKIVERHKGKMWVDSSPGRGATFHFTLPAADAGEVTP